MEKTNKTNVQRRVAFGVGNVHARLELVDEQLAYLDLASRGGSMKSRVAVFVDCIALGAVLEQKPRHLFVKSHLPDCR